MSAVGGQRGGDSADSARRGRQSSARFFLPGPERPDYVSKLGRNLPIGCHQLSAEFSPRLFEREVAAQRSERPSKEAEASEDEPGTEKPWRGCTSVTLAHGHRAQCLG